MSGAMSRAIALSRPKKPSRVIVAARPDGRPALRIHDAMGAKTVQMISASTIGRTPAQNAPMRLPNANRNTAMMSRRSVNIAAPLTHELMTTPRSTRSSRSTAAVSWGSVTVSVFALLLLTRTIVPHSHPKRSHPLRVGGGGEVG